jgi:hypothetical protein
MEKKIGLRRGVVIVAVVAALAVLAGPGAASASPAKAKPPASAPPEAVQAIGMLGSGLVASWAEEASWAEQ